MPDIRLQAIPLCHNYRLVPCTWGGVHTGANSAISPFLIDVQNDFIQALATRIVIPLVAAKALGKKPPDDVFPVIQLKGKRYYLFTPELAAAPATRLKTVVGSATVEDLAKIQNALDRIFDGY